MKSTSFFIIIRLLIVFTLWGCFLPQGHGQTLGEVLRAVQNRNTLIGEQYQSFCELQLASDAFNGTSSSDPNYTTYQQGAAAKIPLIIWNGVSSSSPADPTDSVVNALPVETQMLLLEQAQESFAALANQFIDDRKIKNGIGLIAPLDFVSLPRVTSLAVFRSNLRILGQELTHAHILYWPSLWQGTSTPYIQNQSPMTGDIYVGGSFSVVPEVSTSPQNAPLLAQWPKINATYGKLTPIVQAPATLSGTIEAFTNMNYGVNAMIGLSGQEPFLDNGDTFYYPSNQLIFSQGLTQNQNTTLSVPAGIFGGDVSSLTMKGFIDSNTGSCVEQFNNASAPVLSTFPTSTAYYGPFTPSYEYWSNNTINYSTYFVANFGQEFASISATPITPSTTPAPAPPASLPEKPPLIQITPHFENGEITVRLANNPANDCELVWCPLSQSTSLLTPTPLATRNSLDVRGAGNWEAVYSGRPTDRESEITTWPASSNLYEQNVANEGQLDPSDDNFGPSYARWTYFNDYINEWWHPVLTQLITGTYALDISQQTGQYTIKFYRKDQVSSSMTAGRYTFAGTPVETFTVQNSGGDSQPGLMTITTSTAVYQFTRAITQSTSTVQWTLTVQQTSNNKTLLNKSVTVTYLDPTSLPPGTVVGFLSVKDQTSIDGTALPQITTVYGLPVGSLAPVREDSNQLVQVTETGTDGTRTTSYSYASNSTVQNLIYRGFSTLANNNTSPQPIYALKGITQTGGINPYTATYDSNGQLIDYVSGTNETKYSYSGAVVTETDLLNGSTVSTIRTATTTYSGDMTQASTVVAGASDAKPTIVQVYPGTDPINPWGPKIVSHPDGTFETYSYSFDGSNDLIIDSASGGGTSPTVSVGTEVETVLNPAGQMLHMEKDDALSGVLLDFADETTLQGPFPTTYSRPLGTTESYTYDGEGRVLTHTDQTGIQETITRDALDRISSDVRNGINTTIAYNGPLGKTITCVGGTDTRTETDVTSPFGATQTTTITGPDSVNITRTEDTATVTTQTNDTTTGQSTKDVVQKKDLSDVLTGNASEPWNTSYAFSGTSWTKTVTHGTDSALTSTTTYDPLSRVTQVQTPDPNGSGTQTTTNTYAAGRLSSTKDPDGTTSYAYNADATLEKMSRGSRYLELDQSTTPGTLAWTLKDATQTLWQKTYVPGTGTTPATMTTLPWGDSTKAVTEVASVSGGLVNQSVTGPNGLNSKMSWTDGVPTTGSSTLAGQSQAWNTSPNAFGDILSLTTTPGSTTVSSTPANNLTYNFSTLGLPTGVSGLVNATQSDAFNTTTGVQTTTVTRNSHTVTRVVSPQGYLTSDSGYASPNTTWSAPSFVGSTIGQTLTTSAGTAQFTYSLAGTLQKRTFPDNSAESFVYSNGGALSTWTTPTHTFNLSPDQFGEPTTLTVNGTPMATYGYDNSGQLNSITDAAGTHALTYQEGQVASETVGGQTIGKTYDNLGRVTQISLPGSASVSYTYAANGTLATVTTAGKGTGKWNSYDAASGRPTSFSLGAVSTATAIDSLGRVTNQSSTSSAMGTLSYASSFDTDGHCNSQTTPAGIITYGYDATKGWLHLVSGAENFTYNFDEAGRLQGSTDYYPTSITNPVNIIVTGTVAPTSTVTINAAAVTVDSKGNFNKTYTPPGATWQKYTVLGTLGTAKAQQIKNIYVPPSTEPISYDGDANRSADAQWKYTWNALDQLTQAVEQTAQTGSYPREIDFISDAQGRRVQKKVGYLVPQTGGGTLLQPFSSTTTLYDGWRPVVDTDYDGNGNVTDTRIYTWGPDMSGSLDGAGGIGGLLEIKETQGGATTLNVPITDGQGNIIGLVDEASGALVAQYVLGPFGEQLGQYGPRANTCPFRFSTRRYDPETGFYCFGKRYFDPVSKVWLSRDPAREGGGTNLYAYCQDNPVGNIDPFGLSDVLDVRVNNGVPEVLYHDSTWASFFGIGNGITQWGTPTNQDLYHYFRLSKSGWRVADSNEQYDASLDLFAFDSNVEADRTQRNLNTELKLAGGSALALTGVGAAVEYGPALYAAGSWELAGARGAPLAYLFLRGPYVVGGIGEGVYAYNTGGVGSGFAPTGDEIAGLESTTIESFGARMRNPMDEEQKFVLSSDVSAYWEKYYAAVGKQGDDITAALNQYQAEGIKFRLGEEPLFSRAYNAVFYTPEIKSWALEEEVLHWKAFNQGFLKLEKEALAKKLRLVRPTIYRPASVAEEIVIKQYLLNNFSDLGSADKELLQAQIDQLSKAGFTYGY